eukprot:Lithocolla_globosa_v1_NODE_2496_length_1980_cov_5.944935.p3 type:complete len:160 gc:universal NODE_2496_length_1980_cov_5.944935:1168-689(-)
MSFQESVSYKTCSDSSISSVRGRKKDARDSDDISRASSTTNGAEQMNRHRLWDGAHLDLGGKFLQSELLERDEFGTTNQRIQARGHVITFTFLTLTVSQRGKSSVVGNFLVGFITTIVTEIGSDLHDWLDFRHPCHHSPYFDQTTNHGSTNLSNRNGLL